MAFEQQIVALNMQIAESNSQIGAMAIAFDNLRNESGNAIQGLRRLLAEARLAGTASHRTSHKGREMFFVNTMNFEGGACSGAGKEGFNIWNKMYRFI